jgi:hypothetical protein
MKNILVILSLMLPLSSTEHNNIVSPSPPPKPLTYIQPIESKVVTSIKQPVDLVDALIYVESRGNEKAYAPNEEAAGCLQIRPIMVMEVNRILKKQDKKQRYTLDDRWNCGKSKEMFYIWKNFHHKDSNEEIIARNWNGGPNGYKKTQTEKYWTKVKQQLNKWEN